MEWVDIFFGISLIIASIACFFEVFYIEAKYDIVRKKEKKDK